MKPANYLSLLLIFALGFGVVACGGDSSEEQQAATESPADSESNNAPQGLADALKQAEESVRQMQSGEAPEIINFRELKPLLPDDLNGLDRTDLSGETTATMGFSVSQATGKYGEGEQTMEMSLVDIGGVATAMMGMAAWSMTSIDRESDREIERTMDYKGRKAFLRYNKKNRSGELTVIVSNRFLVTVKGRGIEMDDLTDGMDEVDLDDLEDLAPEA